MKNIKILAIETSCDETSASVVENGREVLSNIISSQIDTHKIYGGVVPEIASRMHIEIIDSIIDEALDTANVTFDDIDAIAVTYGPGLVGALLVGVSTAKALAFALYKPLIAVHHIEGHIAANYITHKEIKPPFVCLVVSGGHSHIVHIKDYDDFEILGHTRDDAAGEAFDKVARTLGLGYPGGPLIDKLSQEGNGSTIYFPRVSFKDNKYDFSFSGVKTAVLNYLNSKEQKGEEINKADVAASFQMSVVDVLSEKTIKAAKELGLNTVAIAGGVASNSALRSIFGERAKNEGLKLIYPETILCTDNAAMIGSSAYYKFIKGEFADLDLNAVPNLKLGQR